MEKYNFDEKTQSKAQVDRTEEEVEEVSQWYGPGQDEAGTFFSLIREEHLHEAQEFRRKGYNSQVPEVDPALLTRLREAIAAARPLIYLHAPLEGRLNQSWLLAQIRQLDWFIDRLSGSVMQDWVNNELPNQRSVARGANTLGGTNAAQSLVRRLESTLQTLSRVAHALGAIVDYSTPENRQGAVHEVLVSELTNAFAPDDRAAVTQALGRMMVDAADNAAWSALMHARGTAWEADKPATFGTVIEAVRRDAEKANKKAHQLSGSAQAFFSDIAAFLQSISRELAKEMLSSGQDFVPEMMQKANDETNTSLQGLKALPYKLKTNFKKGKLQLAIVGAMASRYGRGAVRVIQHGDTTATPSKTPERVVADSIIRSILWQWQQPAIKLQYASGAILAKVAELKKIRGLFSSDTGANALGNAEESSDISANEPNDVDIQVRQWVHERIEQEQPAAQQAAKLTVLSQLLDGDIASARWLVARLGKTQKSIENTLKRQRAAVVNMIYGRRSVDIDASLKEVNNALPEIAKALTTAVAALDKALQAAEQPARNFAEAKTQANEAQLLATKAKESISTRSIWLTERPLDEHSRGSRLAKHWANLAKERSRGYWQTPDANGVWASLKNQGLLDATLSTGDPEGYLFATRLAGELENARNNELKLPMSPDEYVALEKSLAEFIVSWGQKRVARGSARLVVELSFEQAVDTVTFGLSSMLRVPYKVLKATIKIPYRVNKVNNYTMPGQDRPYKAMYAMLGKKLKQLGFNLVTAPLPGMIKLPIGAGITAGAALYNQHLESKEKTFSAVYERVALGKNSEKIKMSSLKGMGVDGTLDAAIIGGVKGVGHATNTNTEANIKQWLLDDLSERKGALGEDSVSTPVFDHNIASTDAGAPVTLDGETATPLSVRDELSHIARSADTRLGVLAAHLAEQSGYDDVSLWQSNLDGRSRYSPSGHWIMLAANASDWEKLHEITHGLTARKLRYGLNNPASPLGQLATRIDALRAKARAAYAGSDQDTLYYLDNPQEFIAGLYSGHHDFIGHLSAINTQGRSLLSLMTEALCWLLGLDSAQESALTEAIGLTDEMMGTSLADVGEFGETDDASEALFSAPVTNSKTKKPVLNKRQILDEAHDVLKTVPRELATEIIIDRLDIDPSLFKELKVLLETEFIYDPVENLGRSRIKRWNELSSAQRNEINNNYNIVGVINNSAFTFPDDYDIEFIARKGSDIAYRLTFSGTSINNKSNMGWQREIGLDLNFRMSINTDIPEGDRASVIYYDSSGPGRSSYKNLIVVPKNSEITDVEWRIVEDPRVVTERGWNNETHPAAILKPYMSRKEAEGLFNSHEWHIAESIFSQANVDTPDKNLATGNLSPLEQDRVNKIKENDDITQDEIREINYHKYRERLNNALYYVRAKKMRLIAKKLRDNDSSFSEYDTHQSKYELVFSTHYLKQIKQQSSAENMRELKRLGDLQVASSPSQAVTDHLQRSPMWYETEEPPAMLLNSIIALKNLQAYTPMLNWRSKQYDIVQQGINTYAERNPDKAQEIKGFTPDTQVTHFQASAFTAPTPHTTQTFLPEMPAQTLFEIAGGENNYFTTGGRPRSFVSLTHKELAVNILSGTLYTDGKNPKTQLLERLAAERDDFILQRNVNERLEISLKQLLKEYQKEPHALFRAAVKSFIQRPQAASLVSYKGNTLEDCVYIPAPANSNSIAGFFISINEKKWLIIGDNLIANGNKKSLRNIEETSSPLVNFVKNRVPAETGITNKIEGTQESAAGALNVNTIFHIAPFSLIPVTGEDSLVDKLRQVSYARAENDIKFSLTTKNEAMWKHTSELLSKLLMIFGVGGTFYAPGLALSLSQAAKWGTFVAVDLGLNFAGYYVDSMAAKTSAEQDAALKGLHRGLGFWASGTALGAVTDIYSAVKSVYQTKGANRFKSDFTATVDDVYETIGRTRPDLGLDKVAVRKLLEDFFPSEILRKSLEFDKPAELLVNNQLATISGKFDDYIKNSDTLTFDEKTARIQSISDEFKQELKKLTILQDIKKARRTEIIEGMEVATQNYIDNLNVARDFVDDVLNAVNTNQHGLLLKYGDLEQAIKYLMAAKVVSWQQLTRPQQEKTALRLALLFLTKSHVTKALDVALEEHLGRIGKVLGIEGAIGVDEKINALLEEFGKEND